jgi:hypothetical protein
MSSWYSGLLPYYEFVKQTERTTRRTLFVCFSELSNPATQQATIQKIKNWIYPGGHDELLGRQTEQQAPYKGGHSTSNSNELERRRLFDLVKRYDDELFDGMGFKTTRAFDCAMK